MIKHTSDNKGFSIIELIIVVAIMAVLVAIIAPNLTKYLGMSKKQTDDKNLDEVHSQVLNCISDAVTRTPEIGIIAGEDGTKTATYKLSYNSSTDSTTATVVSNGVTQFATLLSDNLDDAKTSSKVDKSKSVIIITISGSMKAGYTVKQKFDLP